MLHLLVIDGNTQTTNELHVAHGGGATGPFYAQVLHQLAADIATEIVHPADGESSADIAAFDGLIWTGSALNVYRDEPPVRAQVELARRAFATEVPMFGSCWGLQVATVAAGGDVQLSPNRREIGVARDIRLTPAGRSHPMFDGKPGPFAAIAVHSDEVVTAPAAMMVLAGNDRSTVQAASIEIGGGFWGTQYHPEYDLHEIATVMLRYGDRLLEEGIFPTRQARDRTVADLRRLSRDPDQAELASRHQIGRDILDSDMRRREIANWLAVRVRPHAAQRGRG